MEPTGQAIMGKITKKFKIH